MALFVLPAVSFDYRIVAVGSLVIEAVARTLATKTIGRVDAMKGAAHARLLVGCCDVCVTTNAGRRVGVSSSDSCMDHRGSTHPQGAGSEKYYADYRDEGFGVSRCGVSAETDPSN